MVNDFYYDNLEQILVFTGGRQLLNLADIRKFTGMKDLRTIQRHFPLQKGGYISAATFARQLCGGKSNLRYKKSLGMIQGLTGHENLL